MPYILVLCVSLCFMNELSPVFKIRPIMNLRLCLTQCTCIKTRQCAPLHGRKLLFFSKSESYSWATIRSHERLIRNTRQTCDRFKKKKKKKWHYISAKRQIFLRPQSEGIVPVAERRSPAGGGSRHAGRRCWFRAFSWRSLTLMEKKQKKQRVLPASSSQQKLGMMMKTAERNALPSLALENLQQAPRKIWHPSLFCSLLVPLTSPTLPLSIFLLLSRTDPHSWEGLGRAEAERD